MSTQLTDVNDHAPVFGRQVYEVRVNESAPPETRLVRLKVSNNYSIILISSMIYIDKYNYI